MELLTVTASQACSSKFCHIKGLGSYEGKHQAVIELEAVTIGRSF